MLLFQIHHKLGWIYFIEKIPQTFMPIIIIIAICFSSKMFYLY